MITVFGRNYYGTSAVCDYSGESLFLDGINDAVAMNDAIHWPLINSINGATKKHFISMWVRSGYTSVTSGLRFLMTQSSLGFGGGANEQFFRLAYQMTNGSGTPLNLMYVTYRDNTTGSNNNLIERIYPLHGANNTAITGSTGSNNYWLDNNTTATNGNITTNSNDFVHLCAVVTTAPIGIPYGSSGAIELYWNGQKLIDNTTYTKSGIGTESGTLIYATLGCNIANLGSFFKGQIDEVGALQEYSTLGAFKSAYGLSSEQDVVDKLYNDGCPGDVTTHANAANWNYNFYRFESPNQWLSESGSFPISPQNGATTTTTYHA